MHNIVFKNNWLIYSFNKTCWEPMTCQATVRAMHVFRQEKHWKHACFTLWINSVLLHSRLISKKGSQEQSKLTSLWWLLKLSTLCLWSRILLIRFPMNYGYPICSSMFHLISASCSRWLYFVSLTSPFIVFKAFGCYSLSEPCSLRPLIFRYILPRCNLWCLKLS